MLYHLAIIHTYIPEQNNETEKYKTLKETYFTNFRKYKTCKLEERPYKTKIDQKIDEENLKLVNDIVAEQMEEMNSEKGISLWDINVILKCKKEDKYTKRQRIIEQRLRR